MNRCRLTERESSHPVEDIVWIANAFSHDWIEICDIWSRFEAQPCSLYLCVQTFDTCGLHSW